MPFNRGWVVALAGPNGEQAQHHEVPSSEAGLLIGRRDECGIRLHGPTVSAVQCQISYSRARDRFELEDKSSNGVFLNEGLLVKHSRVPLSDGDTIQLTKRWQTNLTLQFRFVLSPSIAAAVLPPTAQAGCAAVLGTSHCAADGRAAHHARPDEHMASRVSRPDPEAREVLGLAQEGWTSASRIAQAKLVPESLIVPEFALKADVATGNVTGTVAATALGAKMREARQRCTATEQNCLELTAELSRLRSAMSSTAVPAAFAPQASLAAGTRAAGQEAFREAEQMEFTAQRKVLQAELTELQVKQHQIKQDLASEEAVLIRERTERTTMDATLNTLVETLAQQKGEHEAWHIRHGEIQQDIAKVIRNLQGSRQLTDTLEGNLSAARADVDVVRCEESKMQRAIESRLANTETVSGLARSLAEDMNGGVSLLLASIEASGSTRESPRCRDASPVGMNSDCHRDIPCHALSAISGKENIIPADAERRERGSSVDEATALRNKRQLQTLDLSVQPGAARQEAHNAFNPSKAPPAAFNIAFDASKRPRLGTRMLGEVSISAKHPVTGAIVIDDRIALDSTTCD